MTRISFMWEKVVANHGAGNVERNIVANTTIPFPVKCYPMQKITIPPFVVKKKRDSSKKTIAPVAIPAIVQNDGKLKLFL